MIIQSHVQVGVGPAWQFLVHQSHTLLYAILSFTADVYSSTTYSTALPQCHGNQHQMDSVNCKKHYIPQPLQATIDACFSAHPPTRRTVRNFSLMCLNIRTIDHTYACTWGSSKLFSIHNSYVVTIKSVPM